MKKIIIFVVCIALVFGLYKVISPAPSTPEVIDGSPDLILFWGEGCPHCEKVKAYISEHQLNSKLKISSKEVYLNKDNQKELVDTVKKCPEIDSSQGVGVPLGFDPKSGKCLLGDQPIIDWLSQK